MELKDAKNLAEKLLAEHGPGGWSFAWNRRKTALGLCVHRKKEIQLSRFFVENLPEYKIKNTILHEIAHALTPGDNHGLKWYNVFISLGGTGETRSDTKDYIKKDQYGYKYRLMSPTGKALKHWLRKPNQSTFEKVHLFYERHKKAETLGKCYIEKI